jgi:hypothetical protein
LIAAFLAAGCGRSPTEPDGRDAHIRLTVVDRVGRPVAGALIDVLDGRLAGTTKLTNAAGSFELTGTAAGTTALRASRDGFHTRTQAFSSNSGGYAPFWLDTLEPPIGLDPGDYTLALSIDLATASTWIQRAPCAGFPIEFASRTYRATIAESSPIYVANRVVTAGDPTLLYHGLFGFGVVGRVVAFEWEDALTEEFPGFRYLDIGGFAPAPEPVIASGSTVSIPFLGDFAYCQLKSARGGYNHCSQVPAELIVDSHSCSSDHATMAFTKR